MLARIGRYYRHARRYRGIAGTLTRHGFDYLLSQLGRTELAARSRRLIWRKGGSVERRSAPERLRLVLEELGPTFIKLGQILSTRGDLLPAEYIRELEKLQDAVSPVDGGEIRRRIADELGRTVEEVFSRFEDEPLAAASVAQVHRACLRDGSEVALKVLRPGVRGAIALDLDILRELAVLAEKRTYWGRIYSLGAMADEFCARMAEETDLRAEGRHMEAIRRNAEGDPRVVIPRVYWDYTTTGLLTMEYLPGTKLTDAEALARHGLDRAALARTLADTVLQQILIDGLFHADPHPGNLTVLSDGRVGFLDFGIVGHLSREMRDHLGRMLLALVRKDAEQVMRVVLRMGIVPEGVSLHALRRDIAWLQDKYYEIPLNRISVGESLGDLLRVARRHRIILPSEIALVIKALATLEGVATMLDPGISIVDIARPFGRRLAAGRLSPENLRRSLEEKLPLYAEALGELPLQVHRVFALAGREGLRLRLEAQATEHLAREVARASRRLVLGILAGALILGASLVRLADLRLFGLDPAVWCLAGGLVLAATLIMSLFRKSRE